MVQGKLLGKSFPEEPPLGLDISGFVCVLASAKVVFELYLLMHSLCRGNHTQAVSCL